jgi:GNAT superfamily N-acetyltransferase
MDSSVTLPLDFEVLGREGSQSPEWERVPSSSGAGQKEDPIPEGARCIIAFRDGEPRARLAFSARAGFSGVEGLTGYVGWYEATEEAAGVAILRAAAGILLAEGAERVVGPLNGSTWGRYRVALPGNFDRGEANPFFSEPVNPEAYAEHFSRAGFEPLLEYESRLIRDPSGDEALLPSRERLRQGGVSIRGLRLDEFDAELRRVYDITAIAFAGNPYFTPASYEAFTEQYANLKPLLDPDLVRLVCDQQDAVIGYVFAFDDILAPSNSPCVVLKTMAVHPDARGMGLGAILVDEIHRAAEARGASVLHALMQVSNASRHISRHTQSDLFRRYVLFGVEVE